MKVTQAILFVLVCMIGAMFFLYVFRGLPSDYEDIRVMIRARPSINELPAHATMQPIPCAKDALAIDNWSLHLPDDWIVESRESSDNVCRLDVIAYQSSRKRHLTVTYRRLQSWRSPLANGDDDSFLAERLGPCIKGFDSDLQFFDKVYNTTLWDIRIAPTKARAQYCCDLMLQKRMLPLPATRFEQKSITAYAAYVTRQNAERAYLFDKSGMLRGICWVIFDEVADPSTANSVFKDLICNTEGFK